MPDFDKNLNPILPNTKKSVPNLDNPATPTPDNYSYSGPSLRDNTTNPIFGNGPVVSKMLPTVSAKELYDNRRYAIYDANIIDIEDQKAYAQSNLDKATNGVLKGLNLAATTIAGGFGMLGGLAVSPFTGRLADIWDNDMLNKLDEYNKEVDQNWLPNYYTNAEKNASWYSNDNWFKTNFLFDKLIKNTGFAVGAMVSGNIANAGLLRAGAALGRGASALASTAEASQSFRLFAPLLKNTSRAFSAGKNIEVASILEKEISSIADLTAKTSKIAEIAKTTNAFSEFGLGARRTAIAAYSSAGEASFEALSTSKEYKEKLIDEYRAANGGKEPVGEALQKINEFSESVGKTSFFGNLAILGVTEFTQLPRLLGSSYAAERKVANSLVQKTDDVLLKEGKYVAAAPTTKFGKIYSKSKRIGAYTFDLKEAGQEGLQYTLQVGTQNYFKKAYETDSANAWVDGFLYGFGGTNEKGETVGLFGSKEGMESLILGGITGSMMQTFGPSGKIAEDRQIKKSTDTFINTLNNAPTFKESFKERLAGANRGVVLQQQQQDAVIAGDELEARDLNADMMHNYLAPRIKYGRFDMVMDDIADLKQEGATEQGLASLKEQGLANINDTVESYRKRLTNFETTAKNTNEIYDSLTLRYLGQKNDDGSPKYSPQVVDKMVYAASKIANYDLRIPQVNMSLAEAGINTLDILQSIIKDNKPNTKATADALKQINELDVTSDIKDELKTQLSDVIELSLRRKLFMEEYDDIKANPSRYDVAQEFQFGETKQLPVTVSQDDDQKPTKRLQIGKEYSLAEPFRKEGAQLQLAPKITVLSQTLGGELEVRLPNGKTSFMTPEEFENYTISDVNNTSQEMADILDKAIDTVLNNSKHAEAKKELAEISKNLGGKKLDKVGWVNSLEDQSLADDIEEEFNRVTKEIFEKINKQKKEAEQLQKNKEEITKQQGELVNTSGTVGTNDPSKDIVTPEGKIPPANILFISGTSESEAEGYYVDENGNALDPKQAAIHIRNQREFLNNVGGMKNRKNMRAILVIPALAKAYGLDGLIEMSYGKPLSEITDLNNVDNGFIAQVFVEQVGDKLFFVDKNGNQIGEVGVQVENISDVIFQTMRTTKTTYNNGAPRYRQGQKEEAEAYAAAWKEQRAKIFSIDPSVSPTPFAFQVSRGIAKMGDTDNHISGVLIDEKNEAQILATDQTLIQIPTTGVVAHHSGQINVPNGRPMLVHNDNVEFLNNRRFTKKQAEGIYEVIKQIATEINEQSSAGKRVIINKKLSRFLQNVLYWRLGKTEAGSNQINISEDGSSISFSGKTYSIPEIADKKDELIEAIEKTFHNVNNSSLSAENFSKPFTEYYMKDGVLVNNEWTNYQTYLLSSKYPNGSARPVTDTPLSTKITKPTDAVPTTHEQKYSTLVGLELPVGVIAKPAAPVVPPTQTTQQYDYDGDTDNIFKTPFGDVIFTVKGNEEPVIDEAANVVIETRDKIIAKIKSKEGNEAFTNEDLIPQAMAFIKAYVNKELATDRALAPKTQPTVTPAPVSPASTTGKVSIVQEKYSGDLSQEALSDISNEDVSDVAKKLENNTATLKVDVISGKDFGTDNKITNNQVIYLLHSEGKKLAVLVVNDETVTENRPESSISGVFVHPSLKGKGLGKAIYRFANNALISNGKKPLLSDFDITPDAIRVWESLVKSGEAIKIGTNEKYNVPVFQMKSNVEEAPTSTGGVSLTKEQLSDIIDYETQSSIHGERNFLENPRKYLLKNIEEYKRFGYDKSDGTNRNLYEYAVNALNKYDELVASLKGKTASVTTDAKSDRINSLKMVIASYQDDVIPGYEEERKNLISQKNLATNPDLVSSLETKIKEYDDAIKGAKESLETAKKELTTLEGTAPAEAPKEPGSFNPNNIGKRDDVGFRKVGKKDRKTDRMTEADLKAFKEWHAKYVPFIPYEILENMINVIGGEKAWGVFEGGVAKFVRGGLRGTEYHEIGEAIWNGMLSPEEQQAILANERTKAGQFTDRETGKKYNYDDPTVSDNMLKERILDDFSDYRLGKLPARTLGEKVRRFFKAIMDFFKGFVVKPSLKEELFKAIDSGKFKDRQLSTESKSMPPQYRAAGHLTEEETNAYVKDMTAIASNIIFGSGKMGTIDKSALYNLRTLTSDDVFSMIEEFYTKQKIRQELGDIAWKDLVIKTKQELKTLMKVDFNDEDLVNINEGETNKNDYAKEPFSTDWKKTAPMGIKFATATLLDRVPTNQENSNSFSLPKPKVNQKYQTFSLLPYTRAFVTMLDKFKNTTSIGKLVSKVIGLANEDANYVSMFQRLGGNMENKTINFKDFKFEDWRFFIEFMQTYTKQKPNAVIQYISQGQVYSGSALVTGIVNKTVSGWVSNLKGLSNETDSVIKWDSVDKSYSVTDLSGIPTGTPQEKVDFLAKIGVIFPIEAWSKLKEQQQKEFTIAVAGLKEYLQKAKQIKSIQKKTLDVAGHYDTLATLLVNVTHPNQETTRINIDGKQSNSFADNNTPSVFENEFNEVSTLDELLTRRPELRDLYSRGSQLLKKGGMFFDKDGKRTSLELKVGYIEGTKNTDDNKSTSSSSLNLGDRFTQEINQNLNGQYYIMIPADGSTEWMMNMGNHVSFEDIEQGKDGWKQINEIFRGYLTDDVALALDANNRMQLRNVGNKAKELRFFKDILSEKTLSKINQMIEENATQQDIEKFIDDNIEDVNESIKKYIDNAVERTTEVLIQNGQIELVSKDAETGVEYYRYKMLKDTFAKNEKLDKNKLTKDDITNVITFVNANYTINNIEFHKIIFGDPYQFAIKEDGTLDATKRFKSFLSPRRTTIDSPELNTFLNEDLNNAGDIQLLPGEPGYHEHKSWMDTVTVSDVTIVGSVANMKNVPEDIRKAFAKTNEGDASSIMMDGTYREMKIKNGQWNIKGVEEAWHQWQMAYTRQNMPEYKYSDDARGRALEKHDIALLKTKEPNHKIEIVKPIVSGVTNGTNRINLVLDKFSQMPLYYSMVQGTNLEKLYRKMMQENKGYVIMISGRKVGAEALYDLYTKNGEFNDVAFNNNIEVPWKAYGVQVETAYEGSGMQTRGSQVTKISTLDLYENGEPIGTTPQRKEEIAKEVNRNREILNDLHRNGYERFLKRLGIEDLGGAYKIVDKRRLAKTLQDEMFRRELSDNVKDSIQLDENGEFIIPFEASPAYLQIKSILYSFVDKEITSPKVHGGSYVQAPVTLWENAKAGRKIAIKTADGYKQITRQEYDKLSPEEQKKVVLTDDTLKFYEDADGKRYCEVMLPHWFKSKLGKHAQKSDEELIKFLNNTKEGKELLSGLGFRIPSQAYSSMDAFKVKAFLPQYMGKTVVVPSEITTKTGSDFDIDKLNMYLKSVYVDKSGEIRIIKLKGNEEATKDFYAKVFDEKLEQQKINKAEMFDAATIMVEGLDDPKNLGDRYADTMDILFAEAYTLEERRDVLDDMMKRLEKLGDKDFQAALKEKFVEDSYRRALENEYYDSLEKLVTMPENFQRLISPVSDDGLKELSNVLDELRGYDENKIKNRLLDRNYMTSLRHAFITAKRWVGIAAVNITGHSLTQKFKAYIDPDRFSNVSAEDRNILKYNGGEMLLDHNTVEDNGKSYISLSGRLDADGKFISDGLSGYATSFVDVAKDPYILKIIKSNLAVGTFMFLRRVGVPSRQLIMFMNQPIIDEYLTMLDNKGVKNLFDSRYISAIKNKFPSTVAETASTLEFNKEELEDNIKNYYATKDLGNAKNREQIAIFNEFLKYAKMAEYSFNFGQASNYDTTKFQSGDSLQLKQWRTEAAQKKNIISSVGDLLEKSFIGVQVEYLDKSMDALGEALVLESPKFTDVTNEVLKAYEQDRFLPKDKFDRIANKIKAAFLDYIIQKRSDIATNLQEQLVDERKSVAQMLTKAKQEFPGVQIIEDLEVDSSGRIGGAQTIKLKVNDKIAYNENMYAGMMRELRDNPKTNALYKGIVRLAILQGTYQSPISIKNIIPVEDYSAHITPILAGLTVDDDIRAFATSNEFQRNEWQDNDVVPVIEPRFQEIYQPESEADLPRKFQGVFKTLTKINGVPVNVPGFFPTIQSLGANTNKRDLMFINSKFQGKVANYDVIKVPRTVLINKNDVTEGHIDVATGREITARDYAERTKKGDLSLRNYYGYQKVKYADGSPVVAYYDNEENPVYVYKFINLHGDGQYATEYYGDGRPSIFNNGSQKNVRNVDGTLVSNEIPDRAIIEYYGGESVPLEEADPITATIEKEAESDNMTKPAPGVENIPNSGLTVEQGNQFIDLLQPQIGNQAYIENKAKTANMMFSFGLRWAKNIPNETEKSEQAKNLGQPRPNRKQINSKEGMTYGYYLTDQNNNPLPSIKELQPIMDFIQSKLGIDMSNYDAMLGNIYDNNSFIHQHRDTTESVTAKNYPVVVLNLGANGNLEFDRDTSSTYASYKKSGQLDLTNGGIYAFGVNGESRFTFHHRIGSGLESANPLKPIMLPNGQMLDNYRITLTFRRASDLEPGMPETPNRVSQETLTSAQPTDGSNPLLAAGVKPTDMYGNAAKDIQMASEATQFIGFGTIMKEGNVSSTDKYAKAWGAKANTGVYTANDVIMVSGSGNFGRGGVNKAEEAEAIRNTLSQKYKPLLEKATAAGASFRIGNQYVKGNLSDQLVAEYLQNKGYTEEKLNGYSRWTKSAQPVVPETKDRQITVNQFNITLKPDGTMFYDNGKEVTDQTTKNKVNVRKELQDGTLRSSVYNNSNYFVLLDNRIVGSGKTNLGKESITDPKIKEAILAKAITYKKTCQDAL
jgi:hypothetical protein